MKKPICFYIHIPFCIHKCVYCAFCSGIAPDKTVMDTYVDALCTEIGLQAKEQAPVDALHTLYLGGGTPSLLSAIQVEKILNSIHHHFPLSHNAEISLEANPEDVSAELARSWKGLGINRISLGLQSMEDKILQVLERRNSRATNLKVVEIIRQAGIDNISGDIILNIPGMTLDQSLSPMLKLGLTHISAYTLSIEEGAALYRMEKEGGFEPLNEQTAMDQYWQAVTMMQQSGYHQYEISNFALSEHYQSRHNRNYWDYGPYYGAGLGASGTWWQDEQLIRYKNTEDMTLYTQALKEKQLPVLDRELLDIETQVQEYLMLNLRKTRGISASHFSSRFDLELFQLLPPARLETMTDYLDWDPSRLWLNKKGQELANPVTTQLWELLQTKYLSGQSK